MKAKYEIGGEVVLNNGKLLILEEVDGLMYGTDKDGEVYEFTESQIISYRKP